VFTKKNGVAMTIHDPYHPIAIGFHESRRYWLQFDTDQHDSTPTSKCATVGAASCATYIKEYIEKTNPQLNSKVAGIHFDNEGVGGNLKAIVEAWDQVRSELGVKVSFTKGIGNCGTQTIFGVSFDYCLGQSYTDDTAKIYVTWTYLDPCGPTNINKPSIKLLKSNGQ